MEMSAAEASEPGDHRRHENPLWCSQTDGGKNGVWLQRSFDSWLQMRPELRNGPKLEPDWWSQLVQGKKNQCYKMWEPVWSVRDKQIWLPLFVCGHINQPPECINSENEFEHSRDVRSVEMDRISTQTEPLLKRWLRFTEKNDTLPQFKHTHTCTLVFLSLFRLVATS